MIQFSIIAAVAILRIFPSASCIITGMGILIIEVDFFAGIPSPGASIPRYIGHDHLDRIGLCEACNDGHCARATLIRLRYEQICAELSLVNILSGDD
jgi:hypothetical protein